MSDKRPDEVALGIALRDKRFSYDKRGSVSGPRSTKRTTATKTIQSAMDETKLHFHPRPIEVQRKVKLVELRIAEK